MKPGISSALVLLAFLAGLWGCQDQGRTKPPEGRITEPTRLPRSDAAIRKVPLGTGPVRADRDRLYQDRLRQGLAAVFMARGIGEQEAQALARGAIPQGKSLGDIYPPDEVPLWGKTPGGLKAQIRKDFQDSGIPRELVETEIDALANQPFSPPQSPKGREFRPDASPRMSLPDPAKLREELSQGLTQAGVPQKFIDAELKAMVGGASPLSQPSAGPSPKTSETPAGKPLPDPAKLREELSQGLTQAGIPQKFIDAELKAMVGGASSPSRPSTGRPPGSSDVPAGRPLPDPATLSQELTEGLEQAGVPPTIIDAEIDGMFPGSSRSSQVSSGTSSGLTGDFP